MKRLIIPILLITLVSPLLISCNPDSQSNSVPPQGAGSLNGVVMDDEEQLPLGTTAQTYEGAVIKIHVAEETGTYKPGGDAPEQTAYESGKLAAEVTSKKDGIWQANLSPGRYFVQAFYGDASYSQEILVEVAEGKILTLDLKLIHGV